MSHAINAPARPRGVAHLEEKSRAIASRHSVLLGWALFAIIYTSDIKIPVPPFEGLPLWLPVAVPLLLWITIFNGSLPQALGTGVAVGALLFTHLVLAHIAFPTPPLMRSMIQIGTLVVVVPLLVAAFRSASDPLLSIEVAVKLFLAAQPIVMLGELALGLHNPDPAYRHYFLPIWRVGGLEREPSHVAVVLAIPLVLMAGYPGLWWKRFGPLFTASVFGIIVLSPASTLAWPILAALTVFALRSGKRLALAAPPVIAGMLIGPMLLAQYRYSNPLAQRIWDVYQSVFLGTHNDYMNVSSIVLAKGMFNLHQTLAHFPTGFGIDNLFYANALYGYSYSYVFGDWNARDAASILIKIGCEFGWLGLAATAIAAAVLALRVRTHGEKPIGLLSALAFGILISCVGRGAGYFDFGFLLVPITAVFLRPNARRAPNRAQGATLPSRAQYRY